MKPWEAEELTDVMWEAMVERMRTEAEAIRRENAKVRR